MADHMNVTKVTGWMPVHVTGYDEEGRPLLFHPACGESHPYIEGEIICPVYRDLNIMLRGAYDKLFEASEEAT